MTTAGNGPAPSGFDSDAGIRSENGPGPSVGMERPEIAGAQPAKAVAATSHASARRSRRRGATSAFRVAAFYGPRETRVKPAGARRIESLDSPVVGRDCVPQTTHGRPL
jgi:hypothetical protein